MMGKVRAGIYHKRSRGVEVELVVEPRHLRDNSDEVWIKVYGADLRMADLRMTPRAALSLVLDLLDNMSESLDVGCAREELSLLNRQALVAHMYETGYGGLVEALIGTGAQVIGLGAAKGDGDVE